MHYKRFKRTGDPLKLVQQIYGGSESHPLYTTWLNMRQRCYNKNKPQFKDWGGRGITVCDEWNSEGGFKRFVEYMGDKPTPQHSLDRIDNNGNYEPGNVRWATRYEQAANMHHVTKTPGVRKTPSGKWMARITVAKKGIHIGVYTTPEEALAARESYLQCI